MPSGVCVSSLESTFVFSCVVAVLSLLRVHVCSNLSSLDASASHVLKWFVRFVLLLITADFRRLLRHWICACRMALWKREMDAAVAAIWYVDAFIVLCVKKKGILFFRARGFFCVFFVNFCEFL